MSEAATKVRRKTSGQRYSVTLPPILEERMEEIKDRLGITTSEAFRRSLLLYGHAVDSDKVILQKSGKDREVLVK